MKKRFVAEEEQHSSVSGEAAALTLTESCPNTSTGAATERVTSKGCPRREIASSGGH